ncbi:MAG: hypothetical protein RBU27_13730 [Bacteroidota bacterium]|nr:hypothetical protein [Bacteroidota bacterium]
MNVRGGRKQVHGKGIVLSAPLGERCRRTSTIAAAESEIWRLRVRP